MKNEKLMSVDYTPHPHPFKYPRLKLINLLVSFLTKSRKSVKYNA